MTAPHVSICVTSYNYGRYLETLIPTLLSQTFRDFEIIVSDNASTDDSRAVVAAFADPRVRWSANAENVGMTRNLDRCLDLARGEWVWFLSADDTVEGDGFLADMLAAAREDACPIVCAMKKTEYVAASTSVVERPFAGSAARLGITEAVRSICEHPSHQPMIGQYLFARRLGVRFDLGMRNISDVDFFLRLLTSPATDGIAICESATFVFRVHGQNFGLVPGQPPEERWNTGAREILRDMPRNIARDNPAAAGHALQLKASRLPWAMLTLTRDIPPTRWPLAWLRCAARTIGLYNVAELAWAAVWGARLVARRLARR